MDKELFSVGYHKGEIDFSVSLNVSELSFKEMENLRSIIVVGIGILEDMWRREQQKKNPPQVSK